MGARRQIRGLVLGTLGMMVWSTLLVVLIAGLPQPQGIWHLVEKGVVIVLWDKSCVTLAPPRRRNTEGRGERGSSGGNGSTSSASG